MKLFFCALLLLIAQPSIAAEDKDIQILQLKKANLEFALQNLNLQAELMKIQFERYKADLDRISAELEAKEKEKK